MTHAPAVDPGEAFTRAVGALWTSLARVPGCDAVIDRDVVYGTLAIPVPPLNFVIGTRFQADTADDRIDRVVRWFAKREMPHLWWVGLEDEPRDLGDRLIRHGLVRDDTSLPGMVARLDHLPIEALPASVTVERVADEATYRSACAVFAAGFSAPPEFGAALEKIAAIGFTDDVPLRTFLARVDGVPVATSLGIRTGDVLGIFNVATLPDVRGRGIGRAVTLAAMRDGAAEGCAVAVLQSSQIGHPVYERLGFRDFGEYVAYVNVAE